MTNMTQKEQKKIEAAFNAVKKAKTCKGCWFSYRDAPAKFARLCDFCTRNPLAKLTDNWRM